MAIKLLFFAQCADWTDRRELNHPVEGSPTLLSVLQSVDFLAPLIAHRQMVRVAVNGEYAEYDSTVHDGDEVAFLPPFSGG